MNNFDLVGFMYEYNSILTSIKNKQQQIADSSFETSVNNSSSLSKLNSQALFMNFGEDNPLIFSSSQSEAIRRIQNFLNNDDHKIFLLKGYAGTGKTAILNFISDYFRYRKQDVSVELMAPTGKAALVLNIKMGSACCSTIHRGIYDTSVFSKVGNCAEEKIEDSEEKPMGSVDRLMKEAKKKYDLLKIDSGIRTDVSKETEKDKKVRIPVRENIHHSAELVLYIFDEASMISNTYSEMNDFVFGSGFLLNDIISYTGVVSDQVNCKIIFCGDPAQLWPVGMNCSPALSAHYLAEHYRLKCSEIEMTEILRQSEGSAIVYNACNIRNSIVTHNFSALNIETGNDVFEIKVASNRYQQCNNSLSPSPEDSLPDFIKNDPLFRSDLNDPFMEAYLVSIQNKISNHTEVITYSNRDALMLNEKIRSFLFGKKNLPVQIKDKLLIRQNAYVNEEIFVFNGEFVQVTEILSEPIEQVIDIKVDRSKIEDEYPNQFTQLVADQNSSYLTGTVRLVLQNLRLRKYDSNGQLIEFDCSVLINELYSQNKELSLPERMAVDKLFRQRMMKISRDKERYYQELRENDFGELLANSIRVQYGYAITCHKAQGSEWDDVFIYGQPIVSMNISEDKYHWYYTALTRAKKRLFVYNPPHLTKFSDIRIYSADQSILDNTVAPVNPDEGLFYAPPSEVDYGNLQQYAEEPLPFKPLPDTDIPNFNQTSHGISQPAVMDMGRLCLKFGVAVPNSITGWLLAKIYDLCTHHHYIISDVQHYNYQERYIVCGSRGERLQFNIFFNNKNTLTKVSYEGILNPFNKSFIESVVRLKGSRYVDSTSINDPGDLDPNLQEIFNYFQTLASQINANVSVSGVKPFSLQLLFHRITEDPQTAFRIDETIDAIVYYKANYRVSNFSVIKTDSSEFARQLTQLINAPHQS